MKYSKELHERLRYRTQITNIEALALLDEIERLQAERRWIPINERLPEDNGTEISEPVLTCYKMSGGMSAVTIRGLLNTGMWYDTSTGFLVNPANVTHWMPLPSAPESEER